MEDRYTPYSWATKNTTWNFDKNSNNNSNNNSNKDSDKYTTYREDRYNTRCY